jgi:uncharacterized protein YhaN
MRLIRLFAHFGVLDGVEITFASRNLQLVVDRNERGKSTLVAAIVAALYGLAPGSRAVLSEHDRYTPLTGNRFDVELDVESRGRRLRIRRDFERGRCSVTDLDTVEDVTARYASGKNAWDVGGLELGLTREQFLRSALVRQGEVAGLGLEKDAATLTTRVQQLVGTNAGDNAADAGIKVLDEALRGYEGVTFVTKGLVGTEIRTLESRVAEGDRRLAELQRERTTLDGQARRLSALQADADSLRGRRAAALQLAAAVEEAGARTRLDQDDQRRCRAEELRAELSKLRDVPVAPAGLLETIARLDAAVASDDVQIAAAREKVAAAGARVSHLEVQESDRAQLPGAGAGDATAALQAAERLRVALVDEREAAEALVHDVDDADMELDARFSARPPHELDGLLRYSERLSALRADLMGKHTGASTPHSGGTRKMAFLAAAAAVVLAGVVLVLFVPVAGVVAILAGAGLGAFALLRSAEPVPASEAARAESERRLELLDRTALEQARGLGFTSIAAAIAALRAWQDARSRLEAARAARDRHAETQRRLTDERSRATALLSRRGIPAHPDLVTPGGLSALHAAINGYRQRQAALEQARAVLAESRDLLTRLEQQRRANVAAFAGAAGAPAETATERCAAQERVRQIVDAGNRRRSLETQVREVEGALLMPEQRTAIVAAAGDGDAPKSPVDEASSAFAYREEAERLMAEAAALDREAGDLRAGIKAQLDRYEVEYPREAADMEVNRAALVRARGFQSAAELAREVLAEVARDAHRDWSLRLNEATGDVLARFATGHGEIRFGERLDFILRDPASGHEWRRIDVDRLLSAGARDQVYLAIRLALAAYFSEPGNPVPLILDDPLVTSDDERFATVMAFLAERAADRQVVLLTCHAERHRWLLRRFPELAGQVACQNLTPAAGAVSEAQRSGR